MTEHEDIRDRLGELLVGALDEPEATRAEEHLSRCDVCCRELAELERLESALVALEPADHRAAHRESAYATLADLVRFLREEKKWWLAPLVTALVLLSLVIVFAEGSAFAPFIYSIF